MTWLPLSSARLPRRKALLGLGAIAIGPTAVRGKVPAAPLQAEYTDRQFGVVADGVTDDSRAYRTIAEQLASGKTLRIEGSGVRLLRQPIRFPQENFTVFCDNSAVFKKGENTPNIDTLIEFSGNHLRLSGGSFDAHIAGNPIHFGRAETLKISGDYARLRDIILIGSQSKEIQNVSTALYVTGRFGLFEGVETHETGSNAVRDQGDFNSYRDLRMFEYGQHGFVKDAGYRNAASTYTSLKGVIARSSRARPMEAILFDHDGVVGELCRVGDVIIDTPANTGPDKIKFAYMKHVEIEGLRVRSHPADTNNKSCSLRFQQGIANVSLRDVVLAGHINFDATEPCNLHISGQSLIGEDVSSPGAIQDFWGHMVVADGVQFRKSLDYVVSLSNNPLALSSKLSFGRCVFHAEPGCSAVIVRLTPFLIGRGDPNFVSVGMISLAPPLALQGGIRRPETDIRWICDNDRLESVVDRNGERRFLVSDRDFPPTGGAGWQIGDRIQHRRPKPGHSVNGYVCTEAGTAASMPWIPRAKYEADAVVYNHSAVYLCRVPGKSGDDSGPRGTRSSIEDGTVVWAYVDRLAKFAINSLTPN